MNKTWWGHYVIVDKGEEYIRFKDYLELSSRIVKAIEYVEKQIPIVKNEINIPNVNTATSELLNYGQLLDILKGGNNE